MIDSFHEATRGAVPMRELGLRIEGSALEPILGEFAQELARAGVTRVRPRFYLSTEWGVPFETVAIAVPFYLAHPELAELHADRTGMIEGVDRADVLRYLRHEMGHVVNYAYKLYERADWTEAFGAITQPYTEEYRPEPWSVRFVNHLPGWYAQKHPDEDWAETFAVWMTPGRDWRTEHAPWPHALAKLELCDTILREIRDRDPSVVDDELDEELSEIDYSLEDYYRDTEVPAPELPPGLAGSLRAVFDDSVRGDEARDAADLIRAQGRTIARAVYTWTGHFPEHTRALLLHLAGRAEALGLRYGAASEDHILVALTSFVTSLAMNYVHRGRYLP